jgi:transcription antitermination factor NusG
MAGGWCILRTSGPGTLRLVASLQDAGFAAWTPTEHVRRRVPRSKSTEHRIVPLAPTYAFVRSVHLYDLKRIERLDVSPHPRFSIFRYYGETVFVRHGELAELRARQQDSYRSSLPASGRAPGKPRGQAFEHGDTVKITSGAFTGFEAYVELSDGLTTTLSVSLFGRAQEIKVETLHLRSHLVSDVASAA